MHPTWNSPDPSPVLWNNRLDCLWYYHESPTIYDLKSAKPLKAIPFRANRFTRPRVDQPNLFQCVMHSAKITRRTGYNDVLQVIISAFGMRHQVVILRPHCLERRMCFCILFPPLQRERITLPNSITNFFSYHRYSTETAMISVP